MLIILFNIRRGLGFWYGARLIASGEYTSTQFFVIFIAIIFGDQAAAQFFTCNFPEKNTSGLCGSHLYVSPASGQVLPE